MKRLVSLTLVLSFVLTFCTFASVEAFRGKNRQGNYEKMSEEVLFFMGQSLFLWDS